MAFWGDYHTHTYYSRNGKKLHAKGSVLENAEAAARAGLREIAITDHGYAHVYGVNGEQAYAEMKADCERAQALTGVVVYAGLENNLNPKCGKNSDIPPFVDCNENNIKDLEIVQGGYHAFVGTPKLLPNMLFWTRNVVLPSTHKLKEHNTAAYKRLIDEYPIDFIGHIGRGIIADVVEVAKYAHSRGVYIELNGRHKTLKPDDIKSMVTAGVEFICNSDAHKPSDVGNMKYGAELIKKYDIPFELIANWERLPNFRSSNFKKARESKTREGGGNVDD